MKALKSMFYSLIVLLVLFSTASAAPLLQEPPEILYVKQGGIGDCSSWEDACDLQIAIGKLPDQIWVAAGTYTPAAPGGVRNISFELESGLKIYGGFPPDGGDWEDRDWELHPTILSGDLNGDDEEDFANNEENSYHVLTATGVNRLAKLDGFIITGGNADGEYNENQNGAGMYNTSGSNPTLTNLKFTGNYSHYYGSALYNDQSNPALTHVNFVENEGDAMYNISSNPILIDVQFIKNGMGMYNSMSNPTLFDVAFVENAPNGGMYNEVSSATLTEVTFFGNSGCKGGGMYNTPDPSNPSNIALENVSFIGNTAVGGGGIYNLGYGLHTTLINVTFSGNHAILGSSDCPGLNPDSGSGFYGYGYGGGVANSRSSMTMTNVTFFENTADNNGDEVSVGGGLFLEQNIGTVDSFVDITNCVFWENSPDTDQVVFVGNNPPAFTYSVIQGGCPTDATCDVIITEDPLLGSLADNGGFTQTHALLPGSSAIDKGNSDPAVCPDTDQRGYTRPIGAGCDIGAYEYGYTLTVQEIGSGLVTVDPDKLEYNLDEQVALTATADPGWTFSGWSGNATVTDNLVTITKDTNLTATFTQDEYILTVNVEPEDSGAVTLDPPQGPYHYGEEVTLTPTANTGYTFDSWSGAEVKDNTVTITGDTTVTANFTQDEYTLTVIVDPEDSGTVTLNPPQGPYHYGEVVTLTPKANPGYTFDSWSGAEVKDNTVTITGNTTVIAHFAKDEQAIYLPLILR